MKTNYRRKIIKNLNNPKSFRRANSGRKGDFKKESNGLQRRAHLPGWDDEDEIRPNKRLNWWYYD